MALEQMLPPIPPIELLGSEIPDDGSCVVLGTHRTWELRHNNRFKDLLTRFLLHQRKYRGLSTRQISLPVYLEIFDMCKNASPPMTLYCPAPNGIRFARDDWLSVLFLQVPRGDAYRVLMAPCEALLRSLETSGQDDSPFYECSEEKAPSSSSAAARQPMESHDPIITSSQKEKDWVVLAEKIERSLQVVNSGPLLPEHASLKKPAARNAPLKQEHTEAVSSIQALVDEYDTHEYQDRLTLLEFDRRYAADSEAWAEQVYQKLRDENNEHSRKLNYVRKQCLKLLYQLVDLWLASNDYDHFEDLICRIFKARRIERILSSCLVMDRAQCLTSMKLPAEQAYGMHWYSKLHLDDQSWYAQNHPVEVAALRQVLEHYTGSATMNKRLFHILFSKKLALQRIEKFARWSRPQLATLHRP